MDNIIELPFDIWYFIVKELTYNELTQLTRVSKYFRFLVPDKSIPQMQYKKNVCAQIIHISNKWSTRVSRKSLCIFIIQHNRDIAYKKGVKQPPGGYRRINFNTWNHDRQVLALAPYHTELQDTKVFELL
tara:strand:+ start:187 stop:576 length:390 start_codon:yes stop_codon:yes gene_type:complete